MDFINIWDNKKCIKKIHKLYLEAFPPEERMPFFMLKMLSKKDCVDFYSIYDEEKFIGIVYNIIFQDIVYIFYLAVDNTLRGNGYGTKILNSIKEKYKDSRIILNIEELDENSDNYEQRLNRFKFYEKNGFKYLNYKVIEIDVTYQMLGFSQDKQDVTHEDYKSLMKNYLGTFLYNFGYKRISK